MSPATPTPDLRVDAANAPSLVGLLERLALLEPPARAPSVIEGLGRWLGWAEAGPLFEALNTAPSAGPRPDGQALAAAEEDLAQVQRHLQRAIAEPVLPAARRPGQVSVPAAGREHDVGADKQRYASLQHTMGNAIGPLRERLRSLLSQAGPEAARLAAVDAMLGRVVESKEQSLLAMMPALLERHAERLRAAAPDQPGQPGADAPWLTTFRADMAALLQAELALRLQPVWGLLEALRNTLKP